MKTCRHVIGIEDEKPYKQGCVKCYKTLDELLKEQYRLGGIHAIQKIQLGKKLEEHYINLWNKL